MKLRQKRRGRRVVVDTSVVISGISAFKSSYVQGKNHSADTLREWVENGNFVWLVTPEILEEYKEVAKRLNVRPNVAGRLANLLKEEAEEVVVRKVVEISPDPGDNCFCACAEEGSADFLVTLNPKDFPQRKYRQRSSRPPSFPGWFNACRANGNVGRSPDRRDPVTSVPAGRGSGRSQIAARLGPCFGVPLDLRTRHRLLADVHSGKRVGIRLERLQRRPGARVSSRPRRGGLRFVFRWQQAGPAGGERAARRRSGYPTGGCIRCWRRGALTIDRRAGAA